MIKSTSILIAACAMMTGCATPIYTRVNVPLPVECKEIVPVRPAMPTEILLPGATPWVLLRAALSEIDRREGYELQLATALTACVTPLSP